MSRGRIVAALSGGVDSSVVAALLREEGWDVIGVTLQLRPCDDGNASQRCCGGEGISAARAVAEQLAIPHYVLNCFAEYETFVLETSWRAYSKGQTPNPCVLCNQHLKWGFLLDRAAALGANAVATGHYARLLESPTGPVLARGLDPGKDQSYFLFSLSREQRARTQFPLGALQKDEVRALARRFGLYTAEKPDSQDVCFVSEGQGFAESLRRRFGGAAYPGEFVDTQGRVVGTHTGAQQFTIGQRRGLGVALGERAYVSAIDLGRNRVVVSTDPSDLAAPGLVARDVVWQETPPAEGVEVVCAAQIRYRHIPVAARIRRMPSDRLEVLFEESVRAVTPGQAVVLYANDRVIAGGWIETVLAPAHHQ